jgi:hypothetical protein
MRKKDQSVRVNFGERDFFFHFIEYKNNVYDKLVEDIFKSEGFVSKYDIELPLIFDYLVYKGYEETYRHFMDGKTFFSNQLIKERSHLRKLISEFKFHEAINLAKQFFKNSQKTIEILNFYKDLNYLLKDEKYSDCLESLLYIRSLNDKYCDENFKNKIEEIALAISYDDFKLMKDKVFEIISSEDIYNQINRDIMKSEFSIVSDEMSQMKTQISTILQVNLINIGKFKIKNTNYMLFIE